MTDKRLHELIALVEELRTIRDGYENRVATACLQYGEGWQVTVIDMRTGIVTRRFTDNESWHKAFPDEAEFDPGFRKAEQFMRELMAA